jgi:molybdenum cofactor synthesis domain-containing protein
VPAFRAAIITVSDSVSQGTREDLSGPAVRRVLEGAGWAVKAAETLPDDFTLLRERLAALCADPELDAVFTTGGTGLGPRDRTPEATTAVMERSVPGLADWMRREGMKTTPLAALSRGVVGVKGRALLVNLPGAPQGAENSLRAILDVLPHAVAVVRGEAAHGEEPAAGVEPALGEPAPATAETLGKEEPL